ncbi:MAG: hypothetical protein ABFR47_07630 [Verrucomicrobiota bacterium]
MAVTKTVLGSLSTRITALTLSATSVETVAHGLPTTPELVSVVNMGATGNTSLQGVIAATTVDATNIVFKNLGGATMHGMATAMVLHTHIK